MWYSDFYNGYLDHKYVSLGIQYFLLARYGSWYIFNPASGSLYHLSFELFLKSYLIKNGHSWQELKSKKFGHNLVKLWQVFKEKVNDHVLDQYDLMVKNLNLWEKIRYIDLNEGGNAAAIELVEGGMPEEYLENLKSDEFIFQKRFRLYLDNMDELFTVFFSTLKIPPGELMKNPDFAHGKQIYEKNNKYNIFA